VRNSTLRATKEPLPTSLSFRQWNCRIAGEGEARVYTFKEQSSSQRLLRVFLYFLIVCLPFSFSSSILSSLLQRTIQDRLRKTLRNYSTQQLSTPYLLARAWQVHSCTSHILSMHSKLTNMRVLLAAAFATFGLIPGATGHSWVEQLRNINDKGQYVGDFGYPRGMIAKTDPGYNGEAMLWLLPEATEKTVPWIGENSILCHPNQRKPEQSKDSYPRLKTAPGQFIAMRYTENGHVSIPNDATNKPKPEKGGTVFIYGTTEPKEDEKLVNVLQWTKDGQGGNKGGVLLATNNYDDGRCYERSAQQVSQDRQKADPNFIMGQVSDGPGNADLRCESNVALPKDAAPGKPYTFYWVWQWNTAPGKDPTLPTGKDQYYTTCIDVDVVDTMATTAQDASAVKFALPQQQDAMSIAVKDYASRTAIYTDAIKGEIGPVFKDAPSATGAPAASASAPAPPLASEATSSAAKPTTPAQSTLATIPRPTSENGTAPIGIPTMTDRPGRKQPDTTPVPVPAPAPGSGGGSGNSSGDSGPVTITDTLVLTVTAPASAPGVTPRAAHVARHRGARIQSKFHA
jgi:hypothetical protein